MSILSINVETREKVGSRACNKLRLSGFIPVVLYSDGNPAVSLQLDTKKWGRYITEQLHLVELVLPDGKKSFAAPREIQKDPMTQAVLHVDFQGVKLDEAAEFNVAVDFTGIPVGVKDGGVTTISSEHVTVECLPTDVPDTIPIDISHLRVGQALMAGDLVLPEGIKLISDRAMVLVSITAVRQVVEEVVAEVPAEGAVEGVVAGEKTEGKPGAEKGDRVEKGEKGDKGDKGGRGDKGGKKD